MKIIDMTYGERMANNSGLTEDNFQRKGFLSMAATLNFADVEHRGDGIMANIDKWASSKDALISRLRKSPDWHEEILSVVKDVKYSFTRSRYDRQEVRDRLLSRLERKLVDKGGDYANVATLLDYNRNGALGYPSDIFISERITNSEEIEFVKNVLKYPRVQEGMKCSRLIQKIIKHWDEHFLEDNGITEAYNNWTEYISETETTYKFVLSVNPADYLLMSYGNTWASCHIVNPALTEGRDGYNGQYRAGTLSYMNDEVTAISYVVDGGTPIVSLPFTPKIMRQVIFLDPAHPRFFQSRMYPAKDGSGHYNLFTNALKSIIGDAFEVEKDKWEQRDLPPCIQDDDHHYADYRCYSQTCVYFVHESARTLDRFDSTFHIGEKPACVKCGKDSAYESNTVYCNRCRSGVAEHDEDEDEDEEEDNDDVENSCYSCGTTIDEDETYWINGDSYCCDCCCRCEHCEDYFPNGDVSTTVSGACVCDSCRDDHYFTCEECDEIFSDNYLNHAPNDQYLCECCYNDAVTRCDRCGENFMNDDINGDGYCGNCADELADEEEEERERIAAEEAEELADTVTSAVTVFATATYSPEQVEMLAEYC